jgi:hypothetical protein
MRPLGTDLEGCKNSSEPRQFASRPSAAVALSPELHDSHGSTCPSSHSTSWRTQGAERIDRLRHWTHSHRACGRGTALGRRPVESAGRHPLVWMPAGAGHSSRDYFVLVVTLKSLKVPMAPCPKSR